MRAILQRIEADIQANGSYARQFEGGYGLPVGSEGAEYRLRADTLTELKSLVAKGVPLATAAEQAKQYARNLISKHNRQRPKDINWQRWEGAADVAVENVQRFAFSLMADPMF